MANPFQPVVVVHKNNINIYVLNVNGACKSTLLRALQGQLPLSGGTIKVYMANPL